MGFDSVPLRSISLSLTILLSFRHPERPNAFCEGVEGRKTESFDTRIMMLFIYCSS